MLDLTQRRAIQLAIFGTVILIVTWAVMIIRQDIWFSHLHQLGMNFRPVLPPPLGSKSDVYEFYTSQEATDLTLKEMEEALRQLPEIDTVRLNYSQVKGSGLIHLLVLPKLEELSLEGAAIDDSGIRGLRGFHRLIILKVSHTTIGDAGVQIITEECPNLRSLDLSNTRITDASAKHLERLTELRNLEVSNTLLSKERFQELRRALPKLKTIEH